MTRLRKLEIKFLKIDFTILTSILFIILISFFLIYQGIMPVLNAAGESFFWTQTDWSGGNSGLVINSDQNTFLSSTSITFSNVGSISLSPKPGWNNSLAEWKYKKRLIFDNSTVNENLQNFPVLILLNNSNFEFSKAKTNGEDIRFIDNDGTTQLNYEIEFWNSASETASIWVNVPQINALSSTDYVDMYYGNQAASNAQSASSVWNSEFAMVQHMGQDPTNSAPQFIDSTNNSNNGTVEGPLASDSSKLVTGKIGRAISFDGNANNAIRMTDNSSLKPSSITLSAWINLTSFSSFGKILCKDYNANGVWGPPYVSYCLSATLGSNQAGVDVNINGTTFSLAGAAYSVGEWVHIVGTFDGNNQLRIYHNGVLANSTTTATGSIDYNSNKISDPVIANRSPYSKGESINAIIDEVRIMNNDVSGEWVKASYLSESNTFISFQAEEGRYSSVTGLLISNIFDSEIIPKWGEVIYSASGTGTIELKVRSGNQSDMLDANDWALCQVVLSNTILDTTNCINNEDRYVQYQIALFPSATQDSPLVEEIIIGYDSADVDAPLNNASNITITGISSGDWTNIEPTINWDAGVDNIGGTGILGYCISLDETNVGAGSSLVNPTISSGVLALLDDGVAEDFCPFIVASTSVDLTLISGLELLNNKEYFFSIKAVDNSGNIYTGDAGTYQDLISFKFDNEAPTSPTYISLPGNFVSSKDVTFTWPISGVDAPFDNLSGVNGLQYKITSGGTWYGDIHNGQQDSTDLLINDGSYTMDSTFDYPLLNDGTNIIYVRTIDNAGNISNVVSGVLKLNTVAPGQVQNLQVTPTDNTINSYSFSWNAPLTFSGQESNLTYCYTVNILPAQNTCNFTQAGQTNLLADAYATQPGQNIMYVVARDEAQNVNYATYESVNFTYSGSAPGIPQNLSISDISIKSQSEWRLALSWSDPSDIGSGIDKFKIYRTTTPSNCAIDISSFQELASIEGNAYVDFSLQQQRHYYCVRACDSASNCSAVSQTVSEIPTGKFTTPPLLVSGPTVTNISTSSANVSWATDREGTSRIQYGTSSGTYFTEDIGVSSFQTSHSVTLNNLKAGTTYYIRAAWTDEDGNTGYSSEKTFTTAPPPTVTSIEITNIGIDFALINFTVSGASRVSVQYGAENSLSNIADIDTSINSSSYALPLRELQDGTEYFFKIILFDTIGNSYDTLETNKFTTLSRPIISDVQIEEVNNVEEPTVRVSWKSNVPVSSVVEFTTANEFESGNRDTVVSLELKTIHELEITGLQSETRYRLIAAGYDVLGNRAQSQILEFTTAVDSKSPNLVSIKIDKSQSPYRIGENKTSNFLITFITSEPSVSYIELGEGTSGNYTRSSVPGVEYKTSDSILLDNLTPNKSYSLRITLKDKSGNEFKSGNIIEITEEVNSDPLEIIIERLSRVFQFISNK